MENAEQIHDRLKKRFVEIKNEGAGGLALMMQDIMKNQRFPAGTPDEWVNFIHQVITTLLTMESHVFNHEIDSLISLMAEMEAQRLSENG